MKLAGFLQSLDKGRIRWYNIIGDNEGSISHLLQIDPITVGCILLTDAIIYLKRGNNYPILIVTII